MWQWHSWNEHVWCLTYLLVDIWDCISVFLHLQQAHYLLHFRPSLDEVEADGRFHVEGVWWGLDRMSRMHVRILFLQFFCVQLFGPGILCHRCWAFGIRVGRGCLSRLRLMHPETLHCRKCCWQMPGLLLCYKTWRGIWRHASNILPIIFLPAADISLKFYLSCPSQAVTLPLAFSTSRTPLVPRWHMGSIGQVDSEEFAEKKTTCMAKVLCSRPPPSKRRTFDVSLCPCIHHVR